MSRFEKIIADMLEGLELHGFSAQFNEETKKIEFADGTVIPPRWDSVNKIIRRR